MNTTEEEDAPLSVGVVEEMEDMVAALGFWQQKRGGS
jgi:hypothetical protein